MVMKILGVVITHPSRKYSGGPTAAYELSLAIRKIIPYKLAMMWDEDNISNVSGLDVIKFRSKNPLSTIMPILPQWAYVPLYSSEIPKFIYEHNFDLVHIHNPIPTIAMREVAETCLKHRIPYCISTHGFWEILDYARIMKFGFLKRALTMAAITKPFLFVVKNATWVFTLSPSDDKILRKLDFPKERSSCVTNGVGRIFLKRPLDVEVDNLRQKLGLINESPKLLFVGSLYPYKGVDTFLESLHYISSPVTAIVGGKFKSSIEKNNLLRRTNASSLGRHKLIFTGWLTDRELLCLYHLADIFVYPTRGDTLPLTILEAMASGLPVVSTEVGGIPFQLAHGAGFVTKPDEPGAIAELTRRLIEDRDLCIQMGRCARKRVEDIFNWDKSALVAIDAYKKIIDMYRKRSV